MMRKLLNEAIKFSAHGLQGLCCPGCGFDYLHSGAVRTYNRAEDAEVTEVTTVERDAISTVVVPSQKVRNPSDRRHGVVIAFGCEGCGELFELMFAQHKGVTLVAWREGKSLPDEVPLREQVFFPPLADEPLDA
jgi:hypothetical protein